MGEEIERKNHFKNILYALQELNIAVTGGTLSVSGYSANATVAVGGVSMPLIEWPTGSSISNDFIIKIGEKRKSEGEEGALFLSPTPYSIGNIEYFLQYKITYLTHDDLIQGLRDRGEELLELADDIEREKNDILESGSYSKADIYGKLIEKVDSSKGKVSKKKSLEELVAAFAQDLNLRCVEVNKRTPSSEIDVRGNSDRSRGIWKALGTPIIFEAKNWEDPASADQIRNLAQKATGAKTRFMIAWSGITGKDELKGARLEIIKAKERGTFILVLTKEDFEKIASGVWPETIVEHRYYALIYDKIE